MKIVYVTATFPYSGGGEVFFIPEINELLRCGHHLRILPRTHGQGRVDEDAKSMVSITEGRPLFSFEVFVEAITELLRAPVPALRVLVTILSRGDMITRLKNLAVYPKGLWAGRLTRRWGADHIHAQWASTTATLALVAHEMSGVPWSFTAHRGDIVQSNLLFEKTAKASFVRFISKSGVKLLAETAPGADSTKFRVINMGVAIPSGEVPVAPFRAESSFTFLTPANLLPVKGHQYLITALAILKARGFMCRLELAGSGPLLTNLEALAANSGVREEVVFLGQLPHHQVIGRYIDHKADAVVLPSVDLGGGNQEGIPVSLIEAMAHGVPVVATTTGGIPELVTPGTGILVPPGDAPALAEALEALIKDEAMRQRLAENGRRRVLAFFDAAAVAKRLAVEMSASTGPVEVRKGVEPDKEIS